MRILIAAHHFLPNFRAGAEQHAYRIAKELQQRGHSVHIVCVERIDGGPADGVHAHDDVFNDLPVQRLSFNLAAAPDRARWLYDNPWIAAHFRALLGRDRPDVFHLVSGYLLGGSALRAPIALGIPTVVSLTDFWFLCPRIIMVRSDGSLSSPPLDPVRCARCLGEEQRRYRLPGRLAPALMQAFWRRRRQAVQAIVDRQNFLGDVMTRVDSFLCHSEYLRQTFIDAGAAPTRLILCRQGVDVPRNRRPPAARSGRPLQIGYAGQIAEHKGVHLLVAAVRKLRHAQLVLRIYGDVDVFPAYTARLRRIAADDARIVFAGVYSGPREREEVLHSLDVTVVPSTWAENNPTAINESLAHGVPVITAALGSMVEAVQHERNGLHFAPGHAGSLAQQLQRLIDDPALLSALESGIGPVRSVPEEVDQIESIYRQIVKATTTQVAET